MKRKDKEKKEKHEEEEEGGGGGGGVGDGEGEGGDEGWRVLEHPANSPGDMAGRTPEKVRPVTEQQTCLAAIASGRRWVP